MCNSPIQLFYFFTQSPDSNPICEQLLLQPSGLPQIDMLTYSQLLGLTCLLESIFYLPLLWKKFGLKSMQHVLILNLATHPMVVFIIPWLLSGFPYAHALLLGEIFAPLIEAIILWKGLKLHPAWAFGIATGANLFSWSVGLKLLT